VHYRIGLKRLHEAGGLVLENAPGEHMQFTLKWFKNEVLYKYLADTQPQR
jgi:palmitoyl-protein thioesterase